MFVFARIACTYRVLMVLHPWRDPGVLTRAWCLFEIFTALMSEATVQMCFSEKDAKGFFGALSAGEFDAKAVCARVDCRNAQATKETDRQVLWYYGIMVLWYYGIMVSSCLFVYLRNFPQVSIPMKTCKTCTQSTSENICVINHVRCLLFGPLR